MTTWTLALFAAAVSVGTTLVFATLGEIMMERVGHLNLGIEGIMLIGAVTGFGVGSVTKQPFLAVSASFVAGMLCGVIYAFLTVTLHSNQVVTGLALTFFGTGIANYLGKSFAGQTIPLQVKQAFNVSIPFLKDIPIVGPILFNQDLFVYLAIILACILGFYYRNTRIGLRANMIGDDPWSADAIGIPVAKYKYIHICLGSGIVALSGAYLSLVYVPSWQENITAGRGWIAVALVIFVGWRPTVALLGSLFFGVLEILGSRLQNTVFEVSKYYTDLLPYVMTILVLIMMSSHKKRNNSPQKLGESYHRESR